MYVPPEGMDWFVARRIRAVTTDAGAAGSAHDPSRRRKSVVFDVTGAGTSPLALVVNTSSNAVCAAELAAVSMARPAAVASLIAVAAMLIATFAAAVIRPLAFTVNCATDVARPKLPTLAFTVARVKAVAPVTSPVCVALVTLAVLATTSVFRDTCD